MKSPRPPSPPHARTPSAWVRFTAPEIAGPPARPEHHDLHRLRIEDHAGAAFVELAGCFPWMADRDLRATAIDTVVGAALAVQREHCPASQRAMIAGLFHDDPLLATDRNRLALAATLRGRQGFIAGLLLGAASGAAVATLATIVLVAAAL